MVANRPAYGERRWHTVHRQADRRGEFEHSEESRGTRYGHPDTEHALQKECGGEGHRESNGEEPEVQTDGVHQPVRCGPPEDCQESARILEHRQMLGQTNFQRGRGQPKHRLQWFEITPGVRLECQNAKRHIPVSRQFPRNRQQFLMALMQAIEIPDSDHTAPQGFFYIVLRTKQFHSHANSPAYFRLGIERDCAPSQAPALR